MGLCAAAQSVAYIVANPLIGMPVKRTHGYSASLVMLGVWVIPRCLLWLLWPPRGPVTA